jgi:hypothetical protein
LPQRYGGIFGGRRGDFWLPHSWGNVANKLPQMDYVHEIPRMGQRCGC